MPDDVVTPPLISPTSRHPGDVLRLVVGLLVLLVAVLAVYRDHLSTFETNLFRLINDLPAAIGPYLDVIMQAGNVVAAPILAVVAMVALRRRNWRMGFDIATAGIVAWFAAKFVKDLIQRPRPGGLLDDVARFGSTEGLGFVSGHTAVAAALACAAAPYLPRSARRAVWAVPWIVGLARIYFGAHLPLDIIGGAALGWMIGAAIHLVLGAPHGAPTLDDADRVLRAAGWRPLGLERLPGTPQGSFPFVASLDDGTVFVKLLDPDTRDRDVIVRLARFVAFRDVRDEAAVLDPHDQANREAAMTLLARQHGARVPNVLAITRHPRQRDLVWLVLEHVPSRDLRRATPDELTDDLLVDLWYQVAALRRAGIAHRDLVASNILLDADRQPWIVDFAHAESSARPHSLANDVAELLVGTALVAGPERAVAAAVEVLGAAPVAEALPEVVPYALTPETRRQVRTVDRSADDPAGLDTLEHLRAAMVRRTAHQLPSGPPPPVPSWTRFGTAAALVIGVAGVLAALAGPADVVDQLVAVSPRWLGVATVAWAVAATSAAIVVVGAVERRLAIGRTAVVLAIAAAGALSAGRRMSTSLTAGLFAEAGVPAPETRVATKRARIAQWGAWAVVSVAAIVQAIDVDHELVRPRHLAAIAALGVVAILGHAIVSSGRRRVAGGRPSTRASTAGWGLPGWTPVAVAALVELVAAMVVGIAVVTAFSTPVASSYAAVVSLAAWGAVRAAPIDRAVAVRSVVMTLGVAAAGASLAAAAAVGVLVALVELVALTAAALLGSRLVDTR
jgi:glycosyltransferase 2 family protein